MLKGRKKQRGFTLAELLVTIAIIGFLFAIALPSFQNIGGQSKLDAAANAVHSAAKFARQYAVAHNQPTFLVFHDDHSTSNPELAFKSYAVFTINTHNGTPTQNDGYFVKDWETLPVGISFDPDVDSGNNIFQPTTSLWDAGFDDNNNTLQIQGVSYIILGFKPNGQCGSTSRWIFLAESAALNSPTQRQGRFVKFRTTGKSKIVDCIYEGDIVREVTR